MSMSPKLPSSTVWERMSRCTACPREEAGSSLEACPVDLSAVRWRPSVFLSPLNFLNILGFVGAAVYLVDVKPALQQITGGRGGSRGLSGPW